MLNRLKKYEEEYCRNTYCGNSEGGDFRFEDRGSRLILTAPHAVRTLRDNRPKAPDLCTGALTRLAGEKTTFRRSSAAAREKKETPPPASSLTGSLQITVFLTSTA